MGKVGLMEENMICRGNGGFVEENRVYKWRIYHFFTWSFRISSIGGAAAPRALKKFVNFMGIPCESNHVFCHDLMGRYMVVIVAGHVAIVRNMLGNII